MKFSLPQQIEEVRREIAMRQRVYPGLISRRTLTQREADFYDHRLRAVLATLEALERCADQVRPILIAAQQGTEAGLK